MVSRFGLSEVDKLPASASPVALIVFVHGLFGHPYKTWTSFSKRSSSPGAAPSDLDLRQADEAAQSAPDGGVFWPKQLLRPLLSDVRIFTWGYDANVDNLFTSASQNTVHQHAGNLLNDVADLLEEPGTKNVPIIFVVHSLGGLIVKDALTQSAHTEGTRLKVVAPATIAICFLGTPHRGSGTASLGKIAYEVTTVATKRPNLRLLRALEKNSETLDRISSSFAQLLLKQNIRIYSFREELETRKFLVFNSIIVDADSAKIGDGREEIGSIPANHSNITKFSSAEDIGFKRVSAQLGRWVEEIKSTNSVSFTDAHTACLDSLNDAKARARVLDVRPSYSSTFNWLFDPKEVLFSDWLMKEAAAPGSIFWIQGKPGSGKSTLMKFALQDERTRTLLKNQRDSSWVMAGYFFHDRGSEVQKSLTGMLQELLYQVLDQVHPLIKAVYPLYEGLVKDQRTKSPKWNLHILRAAWTAIMRQNLQNTQILLFLDALDEHQVIHGSEDNDQLAAFVKETAAMNSAMTRIKFCLASRSWTVFERHFGDFPGLVIHKHTRSDILRYTIDSLAKALNLPTSLSQENLGPRWQKFAQEITSKAVGVFIWVRIVVDEMCKGIVDGTPVSVLEINLRKMPTELGELYIHTLKRIEPQYAKETYIMLQLAVCSQVPLSLRAFMVCTTFIMETSIHDFLTSGSERRATDVYLTSISDMRRRLTSRGGGLLEASDTVPPQDGSSSGTRAGADSSVQLIHQTVKEFVRNVGTKSGLPGLEDWDLLYSGDLYLLLFAAFGHIVGANPTFEYILVYASNAEKDLSETSSNAAVAVKHALDRTGSEDQLRTWLIDSDVFDGIPLLGLASYRRSVHDLIPIQLALAADLRSFVRQKAPFTEAEIHYDIGMGDYLRLNAGPRREPGPLPFVLHLAVAALPLPIPEPSNVDRVGMIDLLVELGQPVDGRSIQVFKADRPGAVMLYTDITPLGILLAARNHTVASEEVRLRLARCLLQHRADPNAEFKMSWGRQGTDKWGLPGLQSANGEYRQTCFHYCARFESAEMVRLFLQHGARSDNLDDMGIDPLGYAALRAEEEVLKAFLDAGYSRPAPLRETLLDPSVIETHGISRSLIVPPTVSIWFGIHSADGGIHFQPQGGRYGQVGGQEGYDD